MTTRKPSAFHIEPAAPAAERTPPAEASVRRPRAVKATEPVIVVPADFDVFDAIDEANAAPAPAVPRRVFLSALGILLSLAIGLWLDRLIRDLFARADWLGWTALGVAAIAGLSLLLLVAKEAIALRRLASVEKMRARALEVEARDDPRAARQLVDDLAQFVSTRPETAAGRRALADLKDDIIDGVDLLRLAETELLSPLDERARSLVLDAAKRVSLVTAVSPRALVDIAYVAFEAARLIRRLAELYGARPGTLGFFRLIRSVLAHLAITGSIAAGDSVVQQLVGQGLAARLSAKLGEGVVNGMMTARIGIAAMEATRPLPFGAVKRPGLSDILAVLTRFSTSKGARDDTAQL
jgi:putative membrane protein